MVTILRASAAGVCSTARAAPQASQNFEVGWFSLPQAGQRGASGLPQPPQNFAPGRLALPQPAQSIRLPRVAGNADYPTSGLGTAARRATVGWRPERK